MESCCAKRHENQLEAVAAETRLLAGAGSGDPELDQLLDENDESALFGSSRWERAKLAVWNLFEHPNTSRAAQVCTRASSARSLMRTMCTSVERGRRISRRLWRSCRCCSSWWPLSATCWAQSSSRSKGRYTRLKRRATWALITPTRPNRTATRTGFTKCSMWWNTCASVSDCRWSLLAFA